jgi:hypothetical protein
MISVIKGLAGNAIGSDQGAHRAFVKGAGFLMPRQVEVFAMAELEDAKRWVSE